MRAARGLLRVLRGRWGPMKLTSGIDDVKIKIGRKGNNACGAELMGVLACLDRHEGKESSCKEVMGALKRCMAQASALKKTNHHKAPINYYLQQARDTHPHTLNHTHSPTHTHPHTLPASRLLSARQKHKPATRVCKHAHHYARTHASFQRSCFLYNTLSGTQFALPVLAQFVKNFKR